MMHGDDQGGYGSGTQGLPGMEGALGGQNIAIEQMMKWNVAFFVGACLVFIVGLGTSAHWLSHFHLSPATFFFELSLLVFGVVMLLLDVPIPQLKEHPTVQQVRFQIYKFALFLTRFMGRGVWYLFLATMVFGALWDTHINAFFGGICTVYLAVLGTIAMGKGAIVSHKLDVVKEKMIAYGHNAERFLKQGQTSMSKDEFKVSKLRSMPRLGPPVWCLRHLARWVAMRGDGCADDWRTGLSDRHGV